MRRQGGGLGTTALVLGIVSLLLLVVCGLGVLTAIVGIVIGIVAVVKNSNRGRAWAGIILSALAVVIAAVFLSWVYNKVGDCINLPQELQQRCIENRFGVQIRTPS
jgi:integrin beta 8